MYIYIYIYIYAARARSATRKHHVITHQDGPSMKANIGPNMDPPWAYKETNMTVALVAVVVVCVVCVVSVIVIVVVVVELFTCSAHYAASRP